MNHKTASPQFLKCQASLRAERSILHSSFFILHFLLLSFSASAQTINPRMDSLFHDLDRLGLKTKVERDGLLVGGNSRLTYSTSIYYSPDMYSGTPTHWVDSMLNVEKQKFNAQLRAIRSTLDDLAEQARESYHYEYHKDGQDTIIYSINLSPDTTHNDRYRTPSMTYLSSDEVLTFEFRSFSDNATSGQFGNLRYELTLNDTVPQAEMGRYPLEALERDVERLFKQSGLKPRKAYWAHDRQYSDSAYRSHQYFNDYNSITTLHDSTGIRRDGETYLTIYTIPQPMDAQMLTPVGDDEKAEATRTRSLQILYQLDSLANKFACSHPRQTYQYVVDDHRNFFSRQHYWNDFFRANPTPGDYNESYELVTGVDERGYHFAVAHHKGAKWIPKDWSSLKSYVNGRKEYFK